VLSKAQQMATLEDILHLVAWNGYTRDIRQAATISKATLTDERIWFPHLIHETYTSKNKGRLQIILENKNQFIEDDIKPMKRIEQLQSMAKDAGHMKRFLTQIDCRDNEGESPLTAAINKHCISAVKFLVENGADVNQLNNKGRSPLHLAKSMSNNDKVVKSVLKPNGRSVCAEVKGDRNEKIIAYLSKKGAVDIPERPSLDVNDYLHGLIVNMHMPVIHNYNMIRNNHVNNNIHMNRRFHLYPMFPNDPGLHRYHDLPDFKKPKRMKASLYKQQFGKR